MSFPPDSARQTSVTLEQVSLRFDRGVEALHDLNLRVGDGEFLSVVGPSGCGKSTMLRLVAGLLRPTSGSVHIGGDTKLAGRQTRRDISFVFQQPTLLPWRSVEKNVRLPLELRGRVGDEGRRRVAEVIDLVGLRDFARFYPAQLSGGMQMRVSLARALVTRPSLLILDEPFAALDDITRQRLNEELLALWGRDRFTAIFVTHNVSEAVFLSQRVVVMSARPGRVLAEVPVPFSFPRNAELRAEPDFARLTGDVSRTLRESFR
ncbi:ATP-binding cassette domain-containing protein [bacterium]|nr:ATP-binding cassette domain-containing protein [bacterium]